LGTSKEVEVVGQLTRQGFDDLVVVVCSELTFDDEDEELWIVLEEFGGVV